MRVVAEGTATVEVCGGSGAAFAGVRRRFAAGLLFMLPTAPGVGLDAAPNDAPDFYSEAASRSVAENTASVQNRHAEVWTATLTVNKVSSLFGCSDSLRSGGACGVSSMPTVSVPDSWSLIPSGLGIGDSFRLLFASSTTHDGSSTDIADYNTFVQNRAAAGHTDIQDYSNTFRAVGSTVDVDAIDNTETRHTSADGGVPIYWLGGNKVADDYEDFYDGGWDDEENPKDESGSARDLRTYTIYYPMTGSDHDGTEKVERSRSRALGTDRVTVGRPGTEGQGPLSGDISTTKSSSRPFYGLSAVFQVAAPNNAPEFSASAATRSVAENTASGRNVGAAVTATDADNDPLTYSLEGADAASFDIASTSGQIRTKTGVTYDHEAKASYAVTVQADDGNGATDTIAVTISVTNVSEPPNTPPAAPSVSATPGSTTSLNVSWTAPPNTGRPAINSYHLEYRKGVSGNWSSGPDHVTATSARIGGLTADTAYQVRVQAHNLDGDGPWSQPGSGRTSAPANAAPVFSASTATRSVAENTASGQNVGAAVTATDADGDPLTYSLEGADAASFDIASTSGQIRTKTGVTYDHEAKASYAVTVKADDGNGDTDTIAVTIGITDVNEPPVAPAAPSVSATPGSATSLDVSWTAPSNAGRPAIGSYDLEYREGSSGNWSDGPEDRTDTNATIGRLATGTFHQVRVRATNDEGDGAWSQPGSGRSSGPALVGLFPRASDMVRQGFLRVINHSAEAGEANVAATDDGGMRAGPVVLTLAGGATAHFNSDDLEAGNADKGLPDGVGPPGEGDWRLELESQLDIEVLSYIRTEDGFLTAMHDVAPVADGERRVAIFNPGVNPDQVSRLRLINPTAEDAEVVVTGVDDDGASPGTEIVIDLPAGESATLTPTDLETGAGLDGALGDGAGKWRLAVASVRPIVVMSLLSSPTGHLTNLSSVSPGADDDGSHQVPLFPSASDPLGRQGFLRIVNRSADAGTVQVQAYDDSDVVYGIVTVAIGVGRTVHFNSDDLELGNADKGLAGSTGAGTGDWRLALSSDDLDDIQVLAYIRHDDGFLTSMHDVAPRVEGGSRVAIFNPGSNPDQVSSLRLVNPTAVDAEVTVTGIDDAGASPGTAVVLTVPAGDSRTLDAATLEDGGEDLDGALGDGKGKWRLMVISEQPIVVMSLMTSATGQLTNLSTAPDRDGT